MDATPAALAMRCLHGAGYPVARTESINGPDLVMHRLDGPTMLAELTRHLWRLSACVCLYLMIGTPVWAESRHRGPLPTPLGAATAISDGQRRG